MYQRVSVFVVSKLMGPFLSRTQVLGPFEDLSLLLYGLPNANKVTAPNFFNIGR
jgi:hypothetical protein